VKFLNVLWCAPLIRRLGISVVRSTQRGEKTPRAIPTTILRQQTLDSIDLSKQAKEIDTVLLFIAGHGFNDGPDYRFLATNAEVAADGVLRGSTVVQWQMLQSAVEGAKGRRNLFIDTCHAGNADNPRLGNAAYYANIIAYTDTRFDQTAKEDDNLGHGLFTYALVEGLDGKATTKDQREITRKSLADHVIERVGELAEKQTSPRNRSISRGAMPRITSWQAGAYPPTADVALLRARADDHACK
jgi:uncharacterized caspase-like protein